MREQSWKKVHNKKINIELILMQKMNSGDFISLDEFFSSLDTHRASLMA